MTTIVIGVASAASPVISGPMSGAMSGALFILSGSLIPVSGLETDRGIAGAENSMRFPAWTPGAKSTPTPQTANTAINAAELE